MLLGICKCTARVWFLATASTGQRFLHLGSFLAGTRRLEKNRRVYLGVGFENVMDLRPDQLRGGAQVV
jgi:hypothetical protein